MVAHANNLTRYNLVRIAAAVGERQGWDFSRVNASREQVPWYYGEIVQRYLKPTDTVLDTGTGGGEKFLSFAPYFWQGVGIDISRKMIQAAQNNLSPATVERIAFEVMSVDDLRFPDESFDTVLNRHSIVNPAQIARVLRPGGVFITQQVGPRNAENVTGVFACGPGGQYHPRPDQDMDGLVEAFRRFGCEIVCRAEYDVPYWYHDIESFMFWLKAIPIPQDFDIDRHWEHVAQILAASTTPRGIRTNEHRLLLIVRKGA